MRIRFHQLSRFPRVPALWAVIAAQLVLLAVAIHSTPAPHIDTAFGGASIKIMSDRSWTILPGQCATVAWDLEGIQSVYVDGAGKAGHDAMDFCPALGATNLNFRITAGNGDARTFVLSVQDLTSSTITWLGILGLVLPASIAIWYFATMRFTRPIALDLSLAFLASAAVLLLCLLIQTARPATIDSVLDFLGNVFRSPSWHILGSALAGLVYLSLVIQKLRRAAYSRRQADLLAMGAFFVVVAVMHSLAGLESIGEWEIWPYQAYLEGRPSRVAIEVISRFWIMVPLGLVSIISPDSFLGYHVLDLCMFWGMLALFYGILRQLGIQPWLAFLATFLFLFYPVNSRLMSLRSIVHTFSKLSLLAAIYLTLDCRTNFSRPHLLGIWLALLLNLGTYETGLAIILIVPILWWWRRPWQVWRNINLTMIWFLVPVAKLSHMLLLMVASRDFYGAGMLSGSSSRSLITWDTIRHYLDIIATVYRRTFLYGWQEAVHSIGQNPWIPTTAATLVFILIVVTLLSRHSIPEAFPSRREITVALLGGLLFILPSIGILMWFSWYADDLWRMYVYVPLGAAMAVLAAVALMATLIGNPHIRKAFVIGIIILLMFPALSRLYTQQDYFVARADSKARILMQIIEQSPYIDSRAKLMLLTSIPVETLDKLGVAELRTNMFDSAMYMLYQEGRPKVAFMCIIGYVCSGDDIDMNLDFLASGDDFSDIVMFRLHNDLRVELLRELPPELSGREIRNYDPDRLIDTSAPIPPRALTLLASARRE